MLLARNDTQSISLTEHIDLTMLLEDVTDSLRPLAEEKGLTLSCTTVEKLIVVGDTDSLIRLFANLIDNAIKYTDQGRVTLITRHLHALQAEVCVTDTGRGIAAEHLPHIFERFYRVDASRTSSGTGLGLSIAQAIARAHGGTIEVQSSIGHGTTVIVELPLAHSSAAVPQHVSLR